MDLCESGGVVGAVGRLLCVKVPLGQDRPHSVFSGVRSASLQPFAYDKEIAIAQAMAIIAQIISYHIIGQAPVIIVMNPAMIDTRNSKEIPHPIIQLICFFALFLCDNSA